MPSGVFCPRVQYIHSKTCVLFLMSVMSVDFRKSKMIHLVRVFKKRQGWLFLTFPEVIATSSNCGISTLVRQSQKHFCFLSAALSLLCKNHKVFTLFQRRKVIKESRMSCPEWTVNGRLRVPGRIVRRCAMKTFGHCRTLVSGQAVDTCCQELNGIPPSSRDIRSGGSYINTAPWPPSLTPGAPQVSSVPWPSGPRDLAELHMLQVSFTEKKIDDQTDRPSSAAYFVSSRWLWPSAGLAWLRVTLSLKPQGTGL